MTLYRKIFNEVRKYMTEAEAHLVATRLQSMTIKEFDALEKEARG